MKTPDEIKKGLYLYLMNDAEECEKLCQEQGCPYKVETLKRLSSCGKCIYDDVLAYINSLENLLKYAQSDRAKYAALLANKHEENEELQRLLSACLDHRLLEYFKSSFENTRSEEK